MEYRSACSVKKMARNFVLLFILLQLCSVGALGQSQCVGDQVWDPVLKACQRPSCEFNVIPGKNFYNDTCKCCEAFKVCPAGTKLDLSKNICVPLGGTGSLSVAVTNAPSVVDPGNVVPTAIVTQPAQSTGATAATSAPQSQGATGPGVTATSVTTNTFTQAGELPTQEVRYMCVHGKVIDNMGTCVCDDGYSSSFAIVNDTTLSCDMETINTTDNDAATQTQKKVVEGVVYGSIAVIILLFLYCCWRARKRYLAKREKKLRKARRKKKRQASSSSSDSTDDSDSDKEKKKKKRTKHKKNKKRDDSDSESDESSRSNKKADKDDKKEHERKRRKSSHREGEKRHGKNRSASATSSSESSEDEKKGTQRSKAESRKVKELEPTGSIIANDFYMYGDAKHDGTRLALPSEPEKPNASRRTPSKTFSRELARSLLNGDNTNAISVGNQNMSESTIALIELPEQPSLPAIMPPPTVLSTAIEEPARTAPPRKVKKWSPPAYFQTFYEFPAHIVLSSDPQAKDANSGMELLPLYKRPEHTEGPVVNPLMDSPASSTAELTGVSTEQPNTLATIENTK
eukprot:Colp12_sorted_trinity150504_noHs@17192